jgi:PhnB protein
MAKVKYIPSGYHNVTPSLSFKGTEEAIVWYKNVFGATERSRVSGKDKKIMHAEMNFTTNHPNRLMEIQ